MNYIAQVLKSKKQNLLKLLEARKAKGFENDARFVDNFDKLDKAIAMFEGNTVVKLEDSSDILFSWLQSSLPAVGDTISDAHDGPLFTVVARYVSNAGINIIRVTR